MTKTSWKLIGLVLVATALLVLAGCTNAGAGGDGGGGGSTGATEGEAAEAYTTALASLTNAQSQALSDYDGENSSGSVTNGSCTIDWSVSGSDPTDSNSDFTWTMTITNCSDGSGVTISGTATYEYNDADDIPETVGGTFTYSADFTFTGTTVSSFSMDYSVSFDGSEYTSYTGTVTIDGDTFDIADIVS
jgi:hypothetical protein